MLSPGQIVGIYRVIAPLGAGGLGQVYLAEDTRLGRRVALKVLPPETADDLRSRKRLLREAQAAAALDHPNICTVFDVGEADGRAFIAMQYVEGEALSDRAARRPLGVAATLDIGAQLAAALDEAHRHGIVHRDIKPQNVMLTSSGHVRVLDFGLAKPTPARAADSPTATVLTDSGAIAGTVPYMSPEQVRGEEVDARSDLFSAGVVLYELLCGARPFAAAAAADVMLAILTRDPPPLTDNQAPPEVQRVVRKCLEKDRDRRYQSARDLAIDLENARRALTPAAEPSAPLERAPTAPAPPKPGWGVRAGWGGAIAVAAATALWALTRPSPPLGPIPASEFVPITDLPDSAVAPALSADGRTLAFIRGDSWFLSEGEIYVKLLPNGEATRLTNDSRPKYGPAFTLDGSRIAYTVLDTHGFSTWTVPVLGGTPTQLLPNAAGLAWLDAHHVMFSRMDTGMHMGLVTATEDRGDERIIYFPTHERGMAHLSWLSPDRRSVLLVEMGRTEAFESCRLVAFDGRSPSVPVGPAGACTGAAWSPDGRWMYFSVTIGGASHLWRQRGPNSAPEMITAGATTEEEGVAIAPDGRSIITSVGRQQGSLWFHDAQGDRMLSMEGSVLPGARLSNDGAQAYCLVSHAADRVARGVTRIDLATNKTERFLEEFAVVDFDLSHDERSIVFAAVGPNGDYQIWLAPTDRRSPPRMLANNADSARFAGVDHVLFRSLEGRFNYLDRVALDGTGRLRMIDLPIDTLRRVSPDGRAAVVIAPLQAPASLEATVAVDLEQKTTIPLCSGACRTGAAWSPDGRQFYLDLSNTAFGGDRTLELPVPPGRALPDLSGSVTTWLRTPGARLLPSGPGPVGATDTTRFLHVEVTSTRNLFRIPLR
jgi:Tol biopolymer transport system component